MHIIEGTAETKPNNGTYSVKHFKCMLKCEWCGKQQVQEDATDSTDWYNNVLTAITCRKCGRNQSGKVPAKSNFNGYTRKPEPWKRNTKSSPKPE